ncbi:MAG: AraC family transcriptional regulator [Oscillospiraceae bacterium]|nr:AraC family transcriptional regulator [Oscillospiraceae bacterium]
MKLEKSIYPYNPEARTLPFFLSGIGGSEYQGRINRPDGYKWHQILFCAAGGGTLLYDEKEVKIGGGDYFFLPKDKPHIYYPDGKLWDIRWTAFEGSICYDVLTRFGMTEPIVITPDDLAMEKIFDKMIISQENDILYCDHTCSGLVYDYLIEFHRHMDSNADSSRSRQMSALLPVLRFMNDSFRNDISMTQLSGLMGVTPQHFCRVFKKAMNISPNKFLTQIRLDEAKRLLIERDASVSEAAAKSGFMDAVYFSTVFRKHEGVSPAEYKKNMK